MIHVPHSFSKSTRRLLILSCCEITPPCVRDFPPQTICWRPNTPPCSFYLWLKHLVSPLAYANLLLETKTWKSADRSGVSSFLTIKRNVECCQPLAHFHAFLILVFQGAESRKERNEREYLWMEIRPRKKVEERRSSGKEEHGIAYIVPLFEKGPK